MDMYCPTCTIVLPATAQRCTQCGNIATLAPGSVVTGPLDTYRIDSTLGVGGMGKVYKAIATSSNQEVVVKELYVDNPADLPDARRRFQREAEVLLSLSRPAPFPECYGGYFQDQGREFMAMEFIPGQDLERVLRASPTGKMDENEVLRIGVAICDALAVMHEHIDAAGQPDPLLHRDIKPANAILRPTGEICLLDLGIARKEKQTAGTAQRATLAGTYEYAAPEQVAGQPNRRSDLYSTAATMFHLATGNCFQGDWDARLIEIDALPPGWQPIFRRAIAVDFNLRQRNMREFKADLVQLLPPQLRPMMPIPAQPQQVLPLGLGNPWIRWKPSMAAMINPGEYRKPVAGQVIQTGKGVPGMRVVPYIIDFGGAGPGMGKAGAAVTTGVHGDFDLKVPDVTVPASVKERQIEVVVDDPNTGDELCRDTVTIRRPWVYKRAGAVAGQAAGAVAHGVGAVARGAGNAIAWPFRKIYQGGGAVKAGVQNFLATTDLAGLSLAATLLFLAIFLVGVSFHKWTEQFFFFFVWYNALAISYCSFRLGNRLRRGLAVPKALRKSFLTLFTVFFWIIPMVVLILRTLTG